MQTNAAAGTVPGDWTAAEVVAHKRRNLRLRPDPGATRRDRRLGAAAVALWIVAAVGALIGLLTPGVSGDVLALIAYAVLAAYGTLAFIWISGSGPYLFRGSAASIRSALPIGSWPSVKRQLAGRSPIDTEHQVVIMELAHQQRRLIEGQLAFADFVVVLCLGIAHSNHDWLRWATLVFGFVLLTGGLIAGVVSYRRLGRLATATSD